MSNRLDQERQALLEPIRMKRCKKLLESLGYEVETFGGSRIEFVFKGSLVRFYPYSGWHTGKTITDGRGFNKLLKQIT